MRSWVTARIMLIHLVCFPLQRRVSSVTVSGYLKSSASRRTLVCHKECGRSGIRDSDPPNHGSDSPHRSCHISHRPVLYITSLPVTRRLSISLNPRTNSIGLGPYSIWVILCLNCVLSCSNSQLSLCTTPQDLALQRFPVGKWMRYVILLVIKCCLQLS